MLDRQSLTAMLVIGLAAMLALGAATVFSQPATANISAPSTDEAIAQADMQRRSAPRMSGTSDGGLFFKPVAGGVGSEVPAVRLGTDIVANVSGQTARVTVTQAFRNTSDKWMEATYLYPLPDDGAVDTLKMVVGDRIFDGKIKPREEAREIYEEALANGQKAGLVEQERPNMFRNSIANVGPGETVLVQIEFQAPIRQVAGRYELRIPLVVGPRYVAMGDNGGGSLSRAAALAGSGNILAPTADPDMVARAGSGLNPVSITVNLDPGFTVSDIASAYHEVNIAGSGERRTITLADGAVPADKDFELRWAASGQVPSLGLYAQKNGALDYVMATITPPSAERDGPVPAREMIFVIDNSGSMAGDSMPAARRSLLYALETLRPQDRFNIIRFDDTMNELFDGAVAANRANLQTAKSFTHRLEAEGGTEMLPALRAALRDGDTEGRVRQVIFLTDGSLSNEADMMREISQNRGRSRVFMVGIGSAPNTFLMRRMAEAGRGTFTHVGIGDEAEPQMQRLLDRLAKPVATNLTAQVEGGNIDFAPRDLPDLYAGEPLVLLGRTRHLAGELTVSGTIDGRRWTQTVDLTQATDSDVVAKLWAKRRIEEVEAERWSGEMSHERAEKSIEELGMDFHLVTSRTSLIAVDETPSRPEGMGLSREELPLLLPAGWDFEHLFGGYSASAADWDALAQAMADEEERRERLELPQGSTNYLLTLALGLTLLLSGAAGAVWWRRERLRQGYPTLPSLQRQTT
ncbi:MAG: marine proteobacterial sortase target protein [Erythrobacter sp.]